MAKAWYAYGGGEDYTNVSNYYILRSKNFLCLCGNEICVIYADSNGVHPKDPLSDNIRAYIKLALATEQIQPNIPLFTRKYVYLRLKY